MFHGRLGIEEQVDATDIGLVGDALGENLERDRKPDRPGFQGRLGRGERDVGVDGRDAVGCEDRLGLPFVERGAGCRVGDARERFVHDRPRGSRGDSELRWHRRRCLHQRLLIAPVLNELEEGAYRGLRRIEGRNPRLREERTGRSHGFATNPTGEYR
jgi:hypothetical protein